MLMFNKYYNFRVAWLWMIDNDETTQLYALFGNGILNCQFNLLNVTHRIIFTSIRCLSRYFQVWNYDFSQVTFVTSSMRSSILIFAYCVDLFSRIRNFVLFVLMFICQFTEFCLLLLELAPVVLNFLLVGLRNMNSGAS